MDKEILDDLDQGLHGALDAFRRECTKLRTGRAHASLLDSVRVDYYGAETPLNQVATVSVVDPKLLQVKPWERTMCPHIDKAILAANLGLTPSNRGDVVLVPIPAMTGERRKELVKVVKHLAEEAKVSCRNHRRDAIDLLESIEDFPEDDLTRAKKKVQELVDGMAKKIDHAALDKEAEILEV
ncbi:MAG: ribosome recycling factor [Deltaproteobacteria bacterium]|nr:ribosome recycling factor [Deltaproteobacteria bacterium]